MTSEKIKCLIKLFKPLNDVWFDTRKDLSIDYKNNKYIITWKQAFDTKDCIVANVPCIYEITDLEIIEQMIRDNFERWGVK